MRTLGASCFLLVLASVSGLAQQERYVQYKASKCGGELVVDDDVMLKSLGGPDQYGKKEHCRWRIAARDPNSKLQVVCSAFKLPISPKCSKEHLSLMQGNEEVERFCGQGPKSFTADSGELDIVFKGTRWVFKKGFQCTVRTLKNDASMITNIATTPTPPTKPTTTTKPAPTKPSVDGSCPCGVANLNRIVNGVVVNPPHKYPWHVGLKKEKEYSYWCGGTIINNRYALSAAHCFFNGAGERESDEGLVVGVADHDTSTNMDDVVGVTRAVKVKKVKIHPKYNPKVGNNDVALLLLEETLDFSKNKALGAACLPKDDSKDYAGMMGIAVGWGKLKTGGEQPDKLQEVEIPILDKSCWYSEITPQMLCAASKKGDKDTCQGDSGGPLFVKENSKFVQVGVTSFGFGDCAEKGSPGVYARVSKFLGWIKENTPEAAKCS